MHLQVIALAVAGALVAVAVPVAAQSARTDVTIGVVLEPPNLDPTAEAAAAVDEVVYANVFEGLTRFDPNGAIVPALAESWTISEDGLTYTFALRTGATFHDGTTFDAEDVKFSLDRARGADSVNAQKPLFADIASVDVVDPATVRLTLSRPNGGLLFNLAWGDAVIVAPETASTNVTNPVGTGPFRFGEWVQGDHITLVKSDSYWGTPVRLDRATFKFIGDPNAAFAAMMAGDVDAFPIFPAPELLPQLAADPRFRVVSGSTEGETIVAMNNARAPLDDIRVREAIAHAIDRQAIIDQAMFGFGTPIGTHFAPHHPAYVDLTALSAYDPEKSKALLKEAGHESLTLTLKLPPTPYARRGGEVVAAQLARVGITAQIVPVEWAQWLEQVFGGKDFDLTIISHTEPMDIGIYGRDDYYFGYRSDAFKAIMAELDDTTDPDQRTALMQQAQTRIAEDYVNVYLFELAKVGVENASLRGLWANAPTQATDLTAVYWE